MNNGNGKKSLREFVEAILEEAGGETNNSLYNAFIQPFVDVGKTTAYGIEKLSVQVQTVVQGFLYGLPALMIPFLDYDYEAFREDEKEEVDRIRKKYEKTLQANLDAITSNDAFGLAFLLAPGAVLGGQLAVKAPEAALKVLDVLMGSPEWFKGISQSLASPARIGFRDPGGHDSGAWANYNAGGGGGDGDYFQEASNGPNKDLQKVLKDPKIQTAIQKSPVAKQMRQDGVNVIVRHVLKFLSLQDYNEMRKIAKNDAGFSQVGQALGKLNQAGKIPAQDNVAVTQAMVPEIKKAYKSFWIKQLQQLIQTYPEASSELAQGIKQVESA